MNDDLVARLRWIPTLWTEGGYTSALIEQTVTAAADCIEGLTAERDALRGISNDVLWLTRLAVGSSWPGEMAEQVERAAARVRALLAPEDGERDG